MSPTIVTTGCPLMGTCTYYYIMYYGHIYYIHAGGHNVRLLLLCGTATMEIFFFGGSPPSRVNPVVNRIKPPPHCPNNRCTAVLLTEIAHRSSVFCHYFYAFVWVPICRQPIYSTTIELKRKNTTTSSADAFLLSCFTS